FQAEDGIRGGHVTGVQTCALPILSPDCRRRTLSQDSQGICGDLSKAENVIFFDVIFIMLLGAFGFSTGSGPSFGAFQTIPQPTRSEERRVGKECGARRLAELGKG